MKALSGREFARLVEQRGWRLIRINGSHHVYAKPGSIARLSRDHNLLNPPRAESAHSGGWRPSCPHILLVCCRHVIGRAGVIG
jgi:hypothetical protein